MRAKASAARSAAWLCWWRGLGSSVMVLSSHLLQAWPRAAARRVVAGQAPVIGLDQVVALGLGDRRQVFLPAVREQEGRAFLVEPADLGAAHREDAAQHQLADVGGMRLGIGQRQRRTPGSAEHQPLVRAHDLGAQALDVRDQVPSGVVLQAGVRRGAAAAALVEQQHVVQAGIEQLALHRRAAAAGAAMQEDRRLALGLPQSSQ